MVPVSSEIVMNGREMRSRQKENYKWKSFQKRS